MKVLVTGATGRIGRAFLNYTPPHVQVEILASPWNSTSLGLPHYRADISDHDKVVMAITCSHPHVVVHCAGLSNVEDCEKHPDLAFTINSHGTSHVAEACAQCGAKMVLLSTDYVFDGESGPYTEDDIPNPINVYGKSKFEAESAAKSLVNNLAIIRVSVPFGRREDNVRHNFISWLAEELSENHTVHIATDQLTTPAYLEELAEIIWLVIDKDSRGIIHYGSRDRLSRFDMALSVCEVLQYSQEFVLPVTTGELNFIAPRPLKSGFITDKVTHILGRPPLVFHEALVRMVTQSKASL